jgi:hypothetical protein
MKHILRVRVCSTSISNLLARNNPHGTQERGRAVAQAVSRWLPTAAARVRTRVWSCGICGGQSGVGTGFLRVLRFPLSIFIPPISPQSPSSIIWGWYNRSVVAAVQSGLTVSPHHPTTWASSPLRSVYRLESSGILALATICYITRWLFNHTVILWHYFFFSLGLLEAVPLAEKVVMASELRNSSALWGRCSAGVKRDLSRKVNWTFRGNCMTSSVAGSNSDRFSPLGTREGAPSFSPSQA